MLAKDTEERGVARLGGRAHYNLLDKGTNHSAAQPGGGTYPNPLRRREKPKVLLRPTGGA